MEQYKELIIEVISFNFEDVIRASETETQDGDDD